MLPASLSSEMAEDVAIELCRGGMEPLNLCFSLCVCFFRLRCPNTHVWEATTNANASSRTLKFFSFLALTLAFAIAFAFTLG